MSLENAEGPRSGPGPWFVAGYDGDCSRCGDPFTEGDTIRADGAGDWECSTCEEELHPDPRDEWAAMENDAMRHGGIL